jgi:hypothetical protein
MWCNYKDTIVITLAPFYFLTLASFSTSPTSSETLKHHQSTTDFIMDKVQEVIGKVTGQTKLPTAKLGKNGPQVTRLGYGTMGLVSHPLVL